MKNTPGTYYIIVIENTQLNQIVASGSLILEKKFIHSCGQVRHYTINFDSSNVFTCTMFDKCIYSQLQRGRIEDIVVDSTYRGKQFGKM